MRKKSARAALTQLDNNNAQQEYYLTDLAALANKQGLSAAYSLFEPQELMGVNSRLELSQAEAVMQERLRIKAMLGGVTLLDPTSVTLSYDTKLGQDVLIEPHCFFGPKVQIAEGVTIKAFSHLEGCSVAENAVIGPYARIRPQSQIAQQARIGNFVEIKKAQIGFGSKVNHLSYIGDAKLGEKVNIGAGTITCNYDGYFKSETEIEDGAFIGSNSALVAPVRIGKNALVAAGSTITKDVPAEAIGATRAKQSNALGREKARRTAQEERKKQAKMNNNKDGL